MLLLADNSCAWTSKYQLSQGKMPPLFSSKPDEAIYTSVDITDTIRKESVIEMEKVTDVVNSCTEAKRPLLVETNDAFASYVNDNSIQNFLFDCDGVLYRGTDAMPCASETIQQLIKTGKKVFFVTNNAASTRMELKDKLEKVLNCRGILDEEMMIGSAYVAGQYLKSCNRLNNDSGSIARVHVIGTEGLCSELQSAGFDVTGGQDPVDTPSGMSRDELAAYPFSEGKIEALVIGLDNDFNYRKLCIATVLLQRNPDALLISTNLDAFDLVGFDARHLPGNGALVSAVETASGRTATNVGKPSSTLSKLIMEVYGLKAEETLMVGDRLDTDIKFGNDSGMKSALVLTGCTTSSEIASVLTEDENSQMIPSVIFPHVGYMYDDATSNK